MLLTHLRKELRQSAPTLAALRERFGQSGHSIVAIGTINTFVGDPAAGDYRAGRGMPLGAPVTPGMAVQFGVPEWSRLAIGPPDPVVRRSGRPPGDEATVPGG